jgi:urease accessory protein UreF
VTRDEIVKFAERDWVAIEDDKALHWAARKRTMSPAAALRLGDDLRRHAKAMRPDWPSEAERMADQDTHACVTKALRAVARATR